MCQFENYFFYKIKKSVLKPTLLILFFISFLAVQAQNTVIDSTDLQRRIAFQDSIFNHLIKVQPYNTSKTKQKPEATKFISMDSTGNLSDSLKVVRDFLIKENDSLHSQSTTLGNSKKAANKKQKKVDTTHYSPKKAAVWGAIFPGLGQIYNKRYWKVPIVYGVLATALYFVVSNGLKLKEFNGYIRNIYDSIPNPSPYNALDLSQIETYRNGYRRNVQLASFGTVFAWGLSIVDAVVDAHLRSFDISDKLSIRIKPELNYSNFTYYTGIGVNLNFK